MLVLLKTTGGLNIPLANGKNLTLKGYGLLNDIDSSDWNQAKENPAVKQMLQDGFIIENGKPENVHSDTISQEKSKQNNKINKKIVKEA